jgi:hypothetical protein
VLRNLANGAGWSRRRWRRTRRSSTQRKLGNPRTIVTFSAAYGKLHSTPDRKQYRSTNRKRGIGKLDRTGLDATFNHESERRHSWNNTEY